MCIRDRCRVARYGAGDAVLRHGGSITCRSGREKCPQARNDSCRMANASLTSAPWHGSAPQRYRADMHVHMHRSQCSITATRSNTRHAPWSFFRHATARPCRSKRVVTYPQALARTIHIRCGQPATRWSFFRHILCEPCLLYTSPSPRDRTRSRMPSSA